MSKIKGDSSVSRNLKTRSFAMSSATFSVSASTITLNNFSPSVLIFTGSTADQPVNLGDATTYPQLGQIFVLINDSTKNLVIKDNGGTTLFTLSSSRSVQVYLEAAGSANGTWRFSLFDNKNAGVIGGSGVTPPFFFSKTSGGGAGTYLTINAVPTNKLGYILPGTNNIVKLTVTTSANIVGANAVIQLQKRTALATLSDIATAQVTIPIGAYKATIVLSSPVPIGPDQEVCAYIKSGATSDINLQLYVEPT